MPRAVGQQIRNNLGIGLDVIPRRRPTDDAQFVVVAFADRIGPMLHQKTNDGEAMLFHGEVERIGVVALAADIGTGATLEQQLNRRFAVAEDGLVQRRSHTLAAARVNQLGMRVKQRGESRHITFSSGIAQRGDRLCSCAGRFDRFDVRLQPGPGRESIFVRDHQLCVSKGEWGRGDLFFRQVSPLRMALANASQSGGVRCLLVLQQRLGLFPELFETGTRRKLP